MKVTVYIYHTQVMPEDTKLFHCQNCNRTLFKYNSDEILVANIMGSKDIYAPDQHWIKIDCHSCHTEHRILFQ